MELAVERHELRFHTPLKTAYGTLDHQELAVASLTDDDGLTGRGEAAPIPGYHPVTLPEVVEALDTLAPELSDGLEEAATALADAKLAGRLPGPALAAVDTALWDLRAQYERRPLSALLGAALGTHVAVNASLAATDPGEAAAEAAAAVRNGFGTVKVKVGMVGDVALVRSVRAAVGPEVAVRVDANGGWSVESAPAMLEQLAPLRIELCEEPVHGIEALAAVRERSPGIPIAMDETAAEPGAVGSGATDLVCLKLAAQGGVTGLIDAAAVARAAGSEIYLASSYDGPIGVAAGLHAAAALGVTRACGLATLALFAGVEDPLPPHAGRITVPDTPGLGVPG